MNHHFSHLIAAIIILISLPAFSSTISDNEIDRFIQSVAITSNLLDRIKAKVNQNNTLSKKLAAAQMDGKYTRELVREVEEWPEHSELEKLVTQSGFKSIEEWSLVVDRVFSVVMSANWVVLAASMPMPNSPVAPAMTRETNLFEYLNDEDIDQVNRDKYSNQLKEMCAKLCYDQSDLSVVGARYTEIKSALISNK